jgi:predicted AAA+ superfamily ATPase
MQKLIERNIDPKLFTKSCFLLGPRKVGKSTFLKTSFPGSIYIDLLDSSIYSDYTRQPSRAYEFIKYQIAKNPRLRDEPIIFDEIQRIPLLLNEVHRLIEAERLRFILSGSSARRLVRGGANMLGGRASRITMGGLAIDEIEDFDLLRYINHGGIPLHYFSDNPSRELKDYIQNYIQEEVKGEALVRNLLAFNRFLDLVGIMNGEEVNYTSISRDVGVDAKTVKEYFQILIDTLLGSYLEMFFDRQKRTNILQSPKFYLFDTGVANHLKGVVITKEQGIEFGRSFEHMILTEITSYKNFRNRDFDLAFWRTYERDEVDFVLAGGEVAIEVKSTAAPRGRDLRSLLKFKEIYRPKKAIVITNGPQPRRLDDGIDLLPYRTFVQLLWAGEVV